MRRGPGRALWAASQPLPPPETLAGPFSTGLWLGGSLGWGGTPIPRYSPGGIGVPHFPVLVGRVWQCQQRGWGPAVLTRPGIRLQEAPGLLPWVSGRQRARWVPWGAGDPRQCAGYCLSFLPRRPLHWGGESSTGCQVLPGTAGRVSGLPGCWRRWGAADSPGQGSGQECRWRGGRGSCSLPSLVGVCGVRWGPGATGRNRFGRPGEALSRSAGVELGTADAGVPPAHPAPRS